MSNLEQEASFNLGGFISSLAKKAAYWDSKEGVLDTIVKVNCGSNIDGVTFLYGEEAIILDSSNGMVSLLRETRGSIILNFLPTLPFMGRADKFNKKELDKSFEYYSSVYSLCEFTSTTVGHLMSKALIGSIVEMRCDSEGISEKAVLMENKVGARFLYAPNKFKDMHITMLANIKNYTQLGIAVHSPLSTVYPIIISEDVARTLRGGTSISITIKDAGSGKPFVTEYYETVNGSGVVKLHDGSINGIQYVVQDLMRSVESRLKESGYMGVIYLRPEIAAKMG